MGDTERLLKVNEELRLVPIDAVNRARAIRDDEMARGGPSRPLIDILRDERMVSSATLLILRAKAGAVTELSSPAAPADPEEGSAPPSRRPPEVEQAAALEDHRVGRYVLLEEVGRGGMGSVHRAWDDALARTVAVKLILGSDPAHVERFVREAKIAGRLRHPAIVTVHDAGEAAGRHYIAMEYIRGHPIDRRPGGIRMRLEAIRDIAHALDYAHKQGVIHRDVKPGNVLVDENRRVYLTDFGAAKEVTGELGPSRTGSIIGTPHYMSPEQLRGGSSTIDARTDIYSLGATLYALLAGRPPFADLPLGDLVVAVLKREPEPLRRFNSVVSPELEGIVTRAMSKDPARRYGSMGELAADLDRILKENRFTGRFGLVRQLAVRWLPWLAAGVVLGVALRVGVPALAGPTGPAGPAFEDVEARLRGVGAALAGIEGSYDRILPEPRRRRVDEEIIGPAEMILARQPVNSAARILRARALWLNGRHDEFRRELKELEAQPSRDYRIRWLRALAAVEEALSRAPPVPDPAAPAPSWCSPETAWPAEIVDDLAAVAGVSAADGPVPDDHVRDRPAAKALLLCAEARWDEAAAALAALRRAQPLPLFAAAWARAAYLARRFGELRESAVPRPEREGAVVGLLPPSPSVADLENGLREMSGAAAVVIHLELARALLRQGQDPEPAVTAVLGQAGGEFRGALLATRIQWRALECRDDPAEYDEAAALLGDEPRCWGPRLARLELLLTRAARVRRSGGDAGSDLRQVVAGVESLLKAAPAWPPLVALRAAARMRLGDVRSAWFDLGPLVESPAQADIPVLLYAAQARLLEAEDARRRHETAGPLPVAARSFVQEVLKRAPDHPIALNLDAAALVVIAQESGESRGAEEAIERLDAVLDRLPGFAEARAHRGLARYLHGDVAAALDDFDAALRTLPDLGAARFARGVVRCAAGRLREAADDWKRLLDQDPSWDSPELREWIRRCERP